MRRVAFTHLSWVFCALIAAGALAISAADLDQSVLADRVGAGELEASELGASELGGSCPELPELEEGAELVLMNQENAPPEPTEVQIACVRCNCTLPGTCPAGQTCLACPSPVPPGIPKTCKPKCCFTLVSTPWINGVCS